MRALFVVGMLVLLAAAPVASAIPDPVEYAIDLAADVIRGKDGGACEPYADVYHEPVGTSMQGGIWYFQGVEPVGDGWRGVWLPIVCINQDDDP